MKLTAEHVLGQRALVSCSETMEELCGVLSVDTITMRATVYTMEGGVPVIRDGEVVTHEHPHSVVIVFQCTDSGKKAVQAEIQALRAEREAHGLTRHPFGLMVLPESDEWARRLR